MIRWEDWGPDAFARAKREKKQVLVLLPLSDEGERAFNSELQEVVDRRFVPILVRGYERPDVFHRCMDLTAAAKKEPFVLILADSGAVLYPKAGAPFDAEGAIRKHAASYEPNAGPTAEVAPWTGAVGGPPPKDLDAGFPERTLAAVKALPPSSERTLQWRPDAWRLLAYAGAELGDKDALAKLTAELSAFVKPNLEYSDAYSLSDLSRVCWDLFALTGSAEHGERAAAYTAEICDTLFDSKSGSFKRHAAEGADKPRCADVQAMCLLAALRAAEFPGQKRCHDIVEQGLQHLKAKMYDPVLGMIHLRLPRTVVFGLLQDNAWALLAFTEAFLMTGHKPYREAADEIGRLLFQEYWDRDSGGFLDRAPQHSDFGLLKEKRRPLDLNALALEGIWRLSELKGNANYKKWVKMALQGLTANTAGAELDAGLARVQELLTRGRMDFELVGLLSDPRTDELLGALGRHHLPRKIVSFVDPNDQDYIMAHKLEAATYPRLFACGSNLKRLADTDDPAKISEVLAAARNRG